MFHSFTSRLFCLALLGGLVAPATASAQTKGPRSPSTPNAGVFFVEPADGATVPSTFKVKMGLIGMDLVPAGTQRNGAGHHHIIIDTDLPRFDERIPADFNHLHFGGGQSETELTLPPGDHTLQLLLGDHDHVPHDPPVYSKELRIRVSDEKPEPMPSVEAAAGTNPADRRSPSPQDARVYFVYPQDGAVIFQRSTIRFGLRSNMGVAPAGVDKPNTGHHHLLVDVETPPLDRPLPNDFNHIHLGKGQTEHKLQLTPGEHTLQLVLADHNHIPHDPPVMSERITVTVRGKVKR